MIFTFSFDDSYKSWTGASEVLDEYGYKGVFNVCLRNVTHKRPLTRQRMFPDRDILTWDEVQDIHSMGHEIASHGVRHIDIPLCSDEELDLEINGSYAVFESHGINVSSYTCAFNGWTAEAEQLSRRNYDSFRLGVGVNKLPLKGRTYYVMSAGDAVEYAVANPDKHEWVVGAWHDVNLNGFRRRVRQIKESGIPVKTVRETFTYEV